MGGSLKFDDSLKEVVDRVKPILFVAVDCALVSCVGNKVRLDKKWKYYIVPRNVNEGGRNKKNERRRSKNES